MPYINEPVDYVSPYRIGTYDATVRKINEDGTVALAIFMPGLRVSSRHPEEPILTLRAVRYGPDAPARPRP
jgi:hypothetical protein